VKQDPGRRLAQRPTRRPLSRVSPRAQKQSPTAASGLSREDV
jgi:hypothetical protein